MRTSAALVWAATGAMFAAGHAGAQVIFSDNFDSGASPLWGNERGAWAAGSGVYYATQPSNSPPTLSSLPMVVGDFDLDVDVNQVSDGGIWLRIDAGAQNGTLLVTGGFLHTGRGLYWHTVTNGNFSGAQNQTGDLFNQGDNIHLRITARGATYSVFLNGSAMPVSTFSPSQPLSGHVGLYDFSAFPVQTFDNFVLGAACYANCDGSTSTPVLNINDFICFQNRFAAGDSYANCDGSTTPPVLNINDFLCFQNRFAAGCT